MVVGEVATFDHRTVDRRPFGKNDRAVAGGAERQSVALDGVFREYESRKLVAVDDSALK